MEVQMANQAKPVTVGSNGVDDATLLRRARQDEAAYSTLYRRHLHSVYRYLLARTGNEQDAQDLTSQTFLAAWESSHRYRGEGPVRAWLLRIAWHKLNDHWRQHRPWLPLEAASEVGDPGSPPEELIGRKLRIERVAAALRALSPDRAEALSLRLFGGLRVAEVATVMGKSEAAVRMLLHRGLNDLEERLALPHVNEREIDNG
jgi:RNA polymerase sigma-70 factor, ECF subfamily